MYKLLLFIGLCLFTGCETAPQTWIAEDESGTATVITRGDTLEVIAPKGLTLWYPHRLTGGYRITYNARMILEGGPHDRLADLNCFWAARDPQNPDDFFARSDWRRGIFHRYNSLDLFYVGYGGNDNTTTRFRRYHGTHYGSSDRSVKPLLAQYIDKAHLLHGNTDLHISITVAAGRTTFSVDDQVLFTHELTPGQGDGYFGLRLLANHAIIYGFKIEYL